MVLYVDWVGGGVGVGVVCLSWVFFFGENWPPWQNCIVLGNTNIVAQSFLVLQVPGSFSTGGHRQIMSPAAIGIGLWYMDRHKRFMINCSVKNWSVELVVFVSVQVTQKDSTRCYVWL